MLKKCNSKLLQHSFDHFSKNIIDTSYIRNISKSSEVLQVLELNHVESSQNNEPFPREAKVVVCGGGVMGAAVAYHLAELGWGKHTIVVEQGRAGGGTTWQSSGLVGIFKPTRAQVKLCQSSVKLYQKLDAEGYSSGWKQCGSLCVARTIDRMTVFRRMKAQSVALRVDCELVSPEEAKRLCPLLNVDDLKGGLWIPGDGVGDPYRICLSLLESAKKKVVRDQDGHIYFRERDGCIQAGGFEPVAKPAYEDGRLPRSPVERVLPEDWDHFHVLLQQLLHRVPMLENAALHKLCNGPEAFSPDCKWILGEASEIKNYYVAAGMKTVGISAAGGVGEATAERIVNGFTSYDMYELDVSRFLGLHNNRKFLRDRAREVPGLHYGLQYPFTEFKTGRNIRMSPIYPKLMDAGAVFNQVMGYERPAWFDPSFGGEKPAAGEAPYRIAHTNTFGKPDWFDFVDKEYAACREKVALLDYSSFTKIDLWSKGREVVDSLQYLCSNDVDVPVGSIIHTGMQNERGGYENDCSLARLSENHYMMIAPTIQQTRCKVWIQRHLPTDGTVAMSDVTSMYTAICIMGPFTKSLLSQLIDTDLSPSNFPFFTFKELDIGLANGIRAMNLTHTGELGYVLYIPNEFALHVYLRLLEAGEQYGIKHAGHYAMRALRIERYFAFWGQDLDTMTTPLECGRSWRVKFDKGLFLGRDALLRQKSEGVRRMFVQLLVDDHDADLDLWTWGGEPIYRNGIHVGSTTTTGYGFTFKKQVCLGFVQNLDDAGEPQIVSNEYILGGEYEVDIAGTRYPAKVNLHSPNLPSKYPDQERDAYFATREKMGTEPILRSTNS
ncbi:pyruvate dehydrogenase phosphatase regulatory subunit, mitochondrial isoform X2 [Nilaparvata lugens]|uniref:pyruvate dehydrogenase phosphatase regulatory subunit, mitochondrial isoform X2 n=1 Tax=Nilaparvata lugens TaxID=108931 RepID=UPI00193D0956|nr:pyruvate dehydrogenase phosphatase regulatory subunit, mitochondrial isoform X2 [Nilaparvata lugens]